MAPTALWISKKEQHLLAGTEATYPCFSVGAYPQNRFTWYLDNTPIQKTPSNEIVNKVMLLVEKFIMLIWYNTYVYSENNIVLFLSINLQILTFIICGLSKKLNIVSDTNQNHILKGKHVYFLFVQDILLVKVKTFLWSLSSRQKT